MSAPCSSALPRTVDDSAARVDLLVLAEVRWGYFRTRKQFLLSRFPNRWRIFYAQPPAFGADDPWTPRKEGNVTYFTVPFLKPGTRSALYNGLTRYVPTRRLIEALAERALKRRWKSLGIESRPALLVSNIYCAGMLPRLPRKLVFYDFNDSPFQFSSVPRWAEDYWRRTRDQVDAFFVVSEHYRRELAAETDRPLVVIGNGVEMAHFEAAREIPPELRECPRPRIGYVGMLSHFLDFDVLEALRQSRRGGTLVLIGPGSPATDEAVRALAEREGVRVLGSRPYDALPAYVQALDVGLIPFRANDPYVQGINPNKIYQYLAAGVPVITTPVRDLEPTFPHLVFASGVAETRAAVAQVLDAPRDREGAQNLARPFDWDTLAHRMVSEVERRLAAR